MCFYFKLKSLPDLILGAARIPTLKSTRTDGFGPTRSRERTAQRLYTFKLVSLIRKLIHEFQKNYILDLGDVIKAHQLKANDGEENSDKSVILRVENIIEVSKLQE